jgi:AcrR family transcriptional regulator
MSPRKPKAALATALDKPVKLRQRFSTAEREQQILQGAIKFFSERGLEGQTRDLAKEIGITHPLLYHYFPTKQALIERVYKEVYLGRWKRQWEEWLDDRSTGLEEKMTRFYLDYADTILTPEWVRIFLFSGLSDGSIPGQYLGLLKKKLFPRILHETRHHLGLAEKGPASERETELMWGLHGGIFYLGIRQWVYGQPAPVDIRQVVSDRVHAFVVSSGVIFSQPSA